MIDSYGRSFWLDEMSKVNGSCLHSYISRIYQTAIRYNPEHVCRDRSDKRLGYEWSRTELVQLV